MFSKRYRYRLDESSKKFNCPSCGKKTFVLYRDENGDYFQDNKSGRCDREDKCGHFIVPENIEHDIYSFHKMIEKPKEYKNYEFSENEVLKYSEGTENSTLFRFLSKKIEPSKVIEAFEKYKVGLYPVISNKDWSMFWQIDQYGWVRTAKIIRYGEDGRRKKTDSPIWYHNVNQKKDHKIRQCLFGLHLIEENKKIAVVESEKTAVIASAFIKNYTWMATGGKSNKAVLNEIQGKDVTLFPDLGAYDDWKKIADEMNFNCSDYIEGIATEEQRKEGLDIADFLIK